jgi:hypothetical protein
MTDTNRAEGRLELYQRYSRIARLSTDPKARTGFESMAREALRCAAKIDPAAVANASAMAMAGPR